MNNTDYLYNHLPARFRREDKSGLLKRYLQVFGDTLDAWDGQFDAFWNSIGPATATAEWITFWLNALFGWSWFPRWFTLTDKRRVYGNFARHLARRGTGRGIEKFLLDFGIVARVHKRPVTWSEFVWGEMAFSITQPLNLVVEILHVRTPPSDMTHWGESMVWGEGLYTQPTRPFTDNEIIALVRYQQPHAQTIKLAWRLGGYQPVDYTPVWGQVSW